MNTVSKVLLYGARITAILILVFSYVQTTGKSDSAGITGIADITVDAKGILCDEQ